MNSPPRERLIGAHMPTAGGIDKSITNGKSIGCTAVQVFTKNPRQWTAPALDPEVISRFRQAVKETRMGFTISHDSYLINLAAPDSAILERSRTAFLDELERAEALGIPWVVTHMGAHLTSCEEDSLQVLCESLNWVIERTCHLSAGVALETTAGQGTCLGRTFEQIAAVVAGCKDHSRIGVCLDTCHIFAAGYDIRSEESYEATMAAFDQVLGFNRLKAIHANDSKKGLGSRVDRHEHIGDGEIGLNTFQRLLRDSRVYHVPVIVETPEAETMHEVNVARLRSFLPNDSGVAITVTVYLFGHYKDVHPDEFKVSVPAGSCAKDLATSLIQEEPKLAGLERICRVAVNEEYAAESRVLEEGDIVAFIPPMSGG